MYYSGKNPLNKVDYKSEDVVVPKGDRQRRLHKALLRYHDPVNWPVIREALTAMGMRRLIGVRPDCLVPPQREASADGGRRLQEPRRGKNGERRGNVKSGRENAPAGKGKTRGKRAR